MPSVLSPLVVQGAVAALFLVALIVSAVESHIRDLVWGRLAGSAYAALTRRSREEQQQATAAAERDARIRGAMASIQASLTTWAAHGPVIKTEAMVAVFTANVLTGVAALRSEEPNLTAELDAIVGEVADHRFGIQPREAQALLAALEDKLRQLKNTTSAR